MEYKTKNRDWVKNAALIFLSVLLVLTFFSNTWMNRSLPEVATQYVSSGSITAKVRGTGTVTAVGTNVVKAEETREIRAVMVKLGQEVKAGDVLFVLGQGEASALESARETLRQLELSYQRTAVGISYPSYEVENERIKQAEKAYTEACNYRDRLREQSSSNLPIAQLQAANLEVSELSSALDTANQNLTNEQITLEVITNAYNENVRNVQATADEKTAASTEAANAATDAESDAAAKEAARSDASDTVTRLNTDYMAMRQRQTDLTQKQHDLSERKNVLTQELNDLNTKYSVQQAAGGPAAGEEEITLEMIENARNTLNAVQEELHSVQNELNGLPDSLSAVQRDLDSAKSALTDSELEAQTAAANAVTARANADAASEAAQLAQESLGAAIRADSLVVEQQAKVDAAQAEVDELKAKLEIATDKRDAIEATIKEILGTEVQSEELQAAEKAADAAYLTLLELRVSLQERQASDARSQNISYLDLADLNAQIETAKKKIADLSGGEENQIVAKVSGTVKSIECTAGDTALKGDVLCTIEVPDMGYSLSFSVTNEQARRLKPGDTATVSNYYWGNDISAKLDSIKTDPKNPQSNKLLTFTLTGNVNAGTELTLSVGQKSANYDTVVPKSAIRSDTNGSFVLSVEAKNSPLGNRYVARRVEVSILAEDDSSAAVTADLGYGAYVITTSNAPIKNGDLVRLADNG